MTEHESAMRQVWLKTFLKTVDLAVRNSKGEDVELSSLMAIATVAADQIADHFNNKFPDPDTSEGRMTMM